MFGGWSDRVGRKWIMLGGMLLAIVCYRPIYKKFLDWSNMELAQKTSLASEGNAVIEKDRIGDDSVFTSTTLKTLIDGSSFKEIRSDTMSMSQGLSAMRSKTIYTEKKLAGLLYWKFVFLVFIQIIFVTMVYGPIAAFLVELFPTRIRYTSMSLPYHIGNGVFGGLTPFIAVLLTTIYTSNKLVGLMYPIIVSSVCFVIGVLYITNKIDPDVND